MLSFIARPIWGMWACNGNLDPKYQGPKPSTHHVDKIQHEHSNKNNNDTRGNGTVDIEGPVRPYGTKTPRFPEMRRDSKRQKDGLHQHVQSEQQERRQLEFGEVQRISGCTDQTTHWLDRGHMLFRLQGLVMFLIGITLDNQLCSWALVYNSCHVQLLSMLDYSTLTTPGTYYLGPCRISSTNSMHRVKKAKMNLSADRKSKMT